MKRILISLVLALALAGTTAFAAQNKNAGAMKPAKPAAAASNTGGAMKSGAMKGKGKRHHRKGKGKMASGGGMTKKGNSNKK